ncbi:glycoside hydrolase family 57 protein [Candidatus Parabeggiatoa sp. HSG14]|uniref:glycoside hydrolase family 57 protein n=1 Tax=Candidatus Parabeggiatoa sp. HSG14 TaxID=3055593 RepID=UPI0025A8C877|nr:glycoside hydrolase family 57 protein [Thiotrichales bacterium HSG14]
MEKLKVVMCWHMHQPVYYDWHKKQYQLPWTYLHGIKDYIDMAAHLEAVPKACAVVNFAPTLLEQLDDYAAQIQAFLRDATPIYDPLLAALVSEPAHVPFLNHSSNKPSNEQTTKKKTSPLIKARLELIERCLRSNEERLIQRFKPYQELVELVASFKQNPKVVTYLGEQYFVDILMWYHLAWLGEIVRRNDPRVKALIEKEHGFSNEDRRQLLEIIGELLASIVPRYKALAESGQVELSVTPYAHPIMPLLLDTFSAREAQPDINLNGISCYPDGKERVRWHIRQGLKVFEQHFGFTPHGCWPSEGSVSETTVRLLEEFDVNWVASGGSVLRNSLKKAGQERQSPHRPYCLPKSSVRCFFRDDNLSDSIGFEFAKWHADDAVANLIHHLENIARAAPQTGSHVTSIILDGENAWEHYPENAYYFLSALYKELSEHSELELTTFSRCLDAGVAEFPTLVAGSWVYGTFSTWIGDEDKNRGWQMLIEAKHVFDKVIPRLEPKQREAAERQLAVCEGSDWCWWFGGYNPTEAVHDFDRLYRLHLAHLYRLLDETPPEYLGHAFTHGGGDPATGGVMRRGQENSA